jgi:hypothetical protein
MATISGGRANDDGVKCLRLTGQVEFETSDGDIRRLPAGCVVLAEDTTGKEHITRHPPEGQLVVHVALG